MNILITGAGGFIGTNLYNNLKKKYAKSLSISIKNFWTDENQIKLDLQRKTINATYTWDTRSTKWINFFDEARSLKK